MWVYGLDLAGPGDRWQTLVSAVMNLRFPWNAGNFLTSCKPVSFSRRTLHHGVSKQLFQYIVPYRFYISCLSLRSKKDYLEERCGSFLRNIGRISPLKTEEIYNLVWEFHTCTSRLCQYYLLKHWHLFYAENLNTSCPRRVSTCLQGKVSSHSTRRQC